MSLPAKALPSIEYLREAFDYDPKTGALTWRKRPREHFKTQARWVSWNKVHAGKPAGSVDAGGYLKIVIGGAQRRVHRVVVKWMTGKEPPATVDHIDRVRLNNRWKNLRPATDQQQQWNRTVNPNSATGLQGVKRSRKRWTARIKISGRSIRLGGFATAEEASAAYEAARKLRDKLHGG